MKKFLLSLAIAILAFSAQAQSSTYSANLSAGTTLAFSYPVHISSITVSGTSAGATTVTLYDNSAASTTYTNAAYTSVNRYSTNITSVITNTAGNLQTNTYTGYVTTTTTTAAATNTFPVVAAFTAGASLVNGPNTVDFNTLRGLVLSASTNATIEITYRRLN